jgi:HPt (histidine-containing phosphotransfer) domain-containing protein
MAGGGSIDELLAAARAQYAATLPGKVAALEQIVRQAAWPEARRAAHKLRGSASTYDHVALGESAGAIEEVLLACSDTPDEVARAKIEAHLVEARAAAEQACGEAR